ncbi:MAG: zinc ribbon domain-containing protein [Eubacteriales bacterium]|nr:zinc ribbon domain-containing protein [Eubacteriales bacterium]
MKCPNCGQMIPDDSLYCESCGKSTRRRRPKPKKPLKRAFITALIMTAAILLLVWAAKIFWAPDIVLTGSGEYDVYKEYIANAAEGDYTLVNEPGGDVEIPLSDITGDWYVLLRVFEDGSEDFSVEAEYTAVIEAPDAFDVTLTCTLYDGYNADGSEFVPGKWHMRPAKGSFYQNTLALYFPGKGFELVFLPNRQMYGEPGRFIDVSYDEKTAFGKTSVYQMIIVKLP